MINNNIPETEVIYLHFLNRELYRDMGISKKNLDLQLCRVLKIAYLFNYEPLETSIAFIWESYYDYKETSKILIELLRANLLYSISSFYSVDELVTFNQQLYREEPKRYKMYFDHIPHKLEVYQPEIMKKESTTIRLEYDLKNWIDTGKSKLLNQTEDELLLYQEGKQIKNVIERRENKAITLSLFDNINLSVYNRKQLGRNLSLIHINSYINHIKGDIITGIAGLQFYDRLSKCFPLNDFMINCCIAEICDIRIFSLSNIELLISKEIEFRNYKVAFVVKSRRIIKSLYDGILYETEKSAIRVAICNQIKKAAINMPPLTGRVSWENLLIRISKLDDCLKKGNNQYKKRRMEEDNVLKTMLICTATDKETDIALQKAKECGLSVDIQKFEGAYLYHLGILGGLDLSIVQTEMGTERMGSARDKIRDLSRILAPNYILSTGICFGLKPRSTNVPDGNDIGDIVIANQLQMYETAKVKDKGDDVEFIPRGDRAAVSTELLDAFRISSHLYNGNVKISFGLLLTGNLLVNSEKVVSRLNQSFPDALNGDMEAGGIYSACHDKDIKWIAIKSISDWGYDKTDEHQDLARRNLYDFLFYVLKEGLINM